MKAVSMRNESAQKTEALRDFLRQKLKEGMELPDDQTPIFSSGLLDSFALVELVAFVEETFKIRLADVRASAMDSVSIILENVRNSG